MTISEEKLLAYADGVLPAGDAADVERQLETDSDARALLEDLRASELPYQDAVETLIDVPDLSAIRETIAASASPGPRPFVTRYMPIAASIAVMFVVGLLAGQHLFPPTQPKPTQWAVWVERIASYQALYSRATLSMRNPPAERRDRQMVRISKAIGAKIAAPDLENMGADFKYARMYALDGEPLAQIAYLPKSGEPFSLCLMKTAKGDHGPQYSRSHGLNVATWRHKGVAYVYVGDTPKDLMDRYIESMRRQAGG